MVYCCVGGCSNLHGRKDQKSKVRHFLRFYTIPKDLPLRKKWEARLNRRKTDITASIFVCSDHFHDSDFEPSPLLKSRINFTPKMQIPLKKGSVPNTDPETGCLSIPGVNNAEKARQRAYRFDEDHLSGRILNHRPPWISVITLA